MKGEPTNTDAFSDPRKAIASVVSDMNAMELNVKPLRNDNRGPLIVPDGMARQAKQKTNRDEAAFGFYSECDDPHRKAIGEYERRG